MFPCVHEAIQAKLMSGVHCQPIQAMDFSVVEIFGSNAPSIVRLRIHTHYYFRGLGAKRSPP